MTFTDLHIPLRATAWNLVQLQRQKHYVAKRLQPGAIKINFSLRALHDDTLHCSSNRWRDQQQPWIEWYCWTRFVHGTTHDATWWMVWYMRLHSEVAIHWLQWRLLFCWFAICRLRWEPLLRRIAAERRSRTGHDGCEKQPPEGETYLMRKRYSLLPVHPILCCSARCCVMQIHFKTDYLLAERFRNWFSPRESVSKWISKDCILLNKVKFWR